MAILSDKQVFKLDVKVGHASFLVQGFQALAHLEEDELQQFVILDGTVSLNKVKQITIVTKLKGHDRLIWSHVKAFAPLRKLVVVIERDAPWNFDIGRP